MLDVRLNRCEKFCIPKKLVPLAGVPRKFNRAHTEKIEASRVDEFYLCGTVCQLCKGNVLS